MATINTEKGKWSKPERAKLVVDILALLITTTLTIALFVYGEKISSAKWTNQKLVEKRIALYDSVMPMFNDILCYHNLFGNFKELSPSDIITRKRKLDKIFYTQKYFFSQDFAVEYDNFMKLCFDTNTGDYLDAKIKANLEYHKNAFVKAATDSSKKWQPEWDSSFSKAITADSLIANSYYKLMELLGRDIGVKKDE